MGFGSALALIYTRSFSSFSFLHLSLFELCISFKFLRIIMQVLVALVINWDYVFEKVQEPVRCIYGLDYDIRWVWYWGFFMLAPSCYALANDLQWHHRLVLTVRSICIYHYQLNEETKMDLVFWLHRRIK